MTNSGRKPRRTASLLSPPSREAGNADGPLTQADASSPAVALSRQRCARRRLAHDTARPRLLERRMDGDDETSMDEVLALVRPVLEDMYQFVEGTRCVLGFMDGGARVVDRVGDPSFLEEADALGMVRDAVWSEEEAGTTAFVLALAESFPFQVCGEAHYASSLYKYCTYAAPVHDALGKLLGALVAITPSARPESHTLAMLNAAAGNLTNELSMHLWQGSTNELLSELSAIIQTLNEGVLLLQPDGTIKHMNTRAGHLLGLTSSHASGRRLADVIEMPELLSAAIRTGRQFHDEEAIFRMGGERVACLCSLRAVAASAPSTFAPVSQVSPMRPISFGESRQVPATLASRSGATPVASLRVEPRALAGSFVLTLRSIDRVQRLVHRMSGAEARMRFDNIVGRSRELTEALRLAHIAAESDSTVLLRGETGTGKEVFAQSIHNESERADGPFVAINCAAIPRELISSELFGYEGGAFTGADRQGRPGKFELAHGGTLFLDEIGDMPQDLQTSLLRAIETHSIVRIGGRNVTPVDVRIIAATHQHVSEAVRRGHFRSDLYFRLNVFPIEIPPLRERRGDIPLLLHYILQRLSTRLHHALGIDAEAMAALEAYSWPGNVRELENVIERAVYVAGRSVLTLRDLPADIAMAASTVGGASPAATGAWPQFGALGATPRNDEQAAEVLQEPPMLAHDLRREAASVEAELLRRALAESGGNVTKAAKLLGIDRTTLWRKRSRYQM